MTVTDEELAKYVGCWTDEMEGHVKRNALLRPYLSRLKTRLVVTNNVNAHLAHDAPYDVAVYYYLPGVPDEHLALWKNAIIEVWLAAVLHGFDQNTVTGRRSVMNTRYPVTAIKYLTAFERDQTFEKGYNMVRYLPGIGHVLWGDVLWRNGKPVYPRQTPRPEDYYKQFATPLALME